MSDEADHRDLVGGLNANDLTAQGFAAIKNAGVTSRQVTAAAPAIADTGLTSSLIAAYAENERLIAYLAKARAWGHSEQHARQVLGERIEGVVHRGGDRVEAYRLATERLWAEHIDCDAPTPEPGE